MNVFSHLKYGRMEQHSLLLACALVGLLLLTGTHVMGPAARQGTPRVASSAIAAPPFPQRPPRRCQLDVASSPWAHHCQRLQRVCLDQSTIILYDDQFQEVDGKVAGALPQLRISSNKVRTGKACARGFVPPTDGFCEVHALCMQAVQSILDQDKQKDWETVDQNLHSVARSSQVFAWPWRGREADAARGNATGSAAAAAAEAVSASSAGQQQERRRAYEVQVGLVCGGLCVSCLTAGSAAHSFPPGSGLTPPSVLRRKQCRPIPSKPRCQGPTLVQVDYHRHLEPPALRPATRQEPSAYLQTPAFSTCTVPVILAATWRRNFWHVMGEPPAAGTTLRGPVDVACNVRPPVRCRLLPACPRCPPLPHKSHLAV